MKKIFMLLAMIVTMTAANNASAQIKFGLKGGFNVTDMSLNSSVLDASNRTGFFYNQGTVAIGRIGHRRIGTVRPARSKNQSGQHHYQRNIA